MALSGGLDKDQQSSSLVSALDGGPRLEGSQRSSSPSDLSDLAQNCYGTPFPTQDIKIGILGERNGRKAFDALLTSLSFLGGQC